MTAVLTVPCTSSLYRHTIPISERTNSTIDHRKMKSAHRVNSANVIFNLRHNRTMNNCIIVIPLATLSLSQSLSLAECHVRQYRSTSYLLRSSCCHFIFNFNVHRDNEALSLTLSLSTHLLLSLCAFCSPSATERQPTERADEEEEEVHNERKK